MVEELVKKILRCRDRDGEEDSGRWLREKIRLKLVDCFWI